jgi:cytoskeletal protein CcmA (bactofilin family)
MAWGKKESFSGDQKLDTILGKDTRFEGTLETGGGARVDGRYKGTLKAQGDVIVGEGAVVEAEVTGRNILIAGEVHGQVYASGKLELTNTGRLYGDLQAAKMYVEEGAVFHGECKTILDKDGAGVPIPEATER